MISRIDCIHVFINHYAIFIAYWGQCPRHEKLGTNAVL